MPDEGFSGVCTCDDEEWGAWGSARAVLTCHSAIWSQSSSRHLQFVLMGYNYRAINMAASLRTKRGLRNSKISPRGLPRKVRQVFFIVNKDVVDFVTL